MSDVNITISDDAAAALVDLYHLLNGEAFVGEFDYYGEVSQYDTSQGLWALGVFTSAFARTMEVPK